MDRTLNELRKLEPVSRVEPVLGPCDLVVTGAFRDSRSFQKFLQELGERDFCGGCDAQLTLEGWGREGQEKGPISAWTLIEAPNPEKVMKELQKIPSVNRLYTPPGHLNVIANIAAPETSKRLKTVTDESHRIKDIPCTETLSRVGEEK